MTARPPLEGFRVLDFTRMIAGPYCTQELGDLGAEVIKIESPEGDDSRRPSAGVPGGRSTLHMSVNRNKRSVVLDLKSKAGLEIALGLARHCEVLVENFAPGVADRLGLGYPAVAARNPRLIYCSISGYGSDDPASPPRPAYDGIIQAAAGLMSVNGEADGPPLRTQYAIVDTAAAMTATSSVLAALLGRERDGLGRRIEVSLFDVAMAILAPSAIQALMTGRDPHRMGNRAAQSAPSDAFRTADGMIFVTCGNDRLFRRLVVEGLGTPELAARAEYATNTLRVQNVGKLTEELQAIFVGRTTDEWMAAFLKAGVPAGPVRSVTEALRSDDARRAGTVREVRSGDSTLPLIRSPHRPGTRALREDPPARLGEHTIAVVRRLLEMTEVELQAAAAAGAFGPHGISIR